MTFVAAAVSWVVANWQPVVVCVLAIDAALLPIFPQAGFLKTIQTFLSGLGAK
jgi:hypothetical protein